MHNAMGVQVFQSQAQFRQIELCLLINSAHHHHGAGSESAASRTTAAVAENRGERKKCQECETAAAKQRQQVSLT